MLRQLLLGQPYPVPILWVVVGVLAYLHRMFIWISTQLDLFLSILSAPTQILSCNAEYILNSWIFLLLNWNLVVLPPSHFQREARHYFTLFLNSVFHRLMEPIYMLELEIGNILLLFLDLWVHCLQSTQTSSRYTLISMDLVEAAMIRISSLPSALAVKHFSITLELALNLSSVGQVPWQSNQTARSGWTMTPTYSSSVLLFPPPRL
jgi:hypothetical protein